MSNFEIHNSFIESMVPELMDPDTLRGAHDVVKESNPALHFIHKIVVSGLDTATNYDRDVIEAVSMGAQSYEALHLTTGEQIPLGFIASIVGSSEVDPNFGMALAGGIGEARDWLFDTHHELALGVQAICAAHGNPELASVYGVGGAALAESAYREVYDMWQFEKQFADLN